MKQTLAPVPDGGVIRVEVGLPWAQEAGGWPCNQAASSHHEAAGAEPFHSNLSTTDQGKSSTSPTQTKSHLCLSCLQGVLQLSQAGLGLLKVTLQVCHVSQPLSLHSTHSTARTAQDLKDLSTIHVYKDKHKQQRAPIFTGSLLRPWSQTPTPFSCADLATFCVRPHCLPSQHTEGPVYCKAGPAGCNESYKRVNQLHETLKTRLWVSTTLLCARTAPPGSSACVP
jgi:hypothetical protein